MLLKTKTIEQCKLKALDGEFGKVSDFYFDDQHWTIRYLVADTGGWITGKQVLISPYALGEAFKKEHLIGVNLTRKQIEDSPSLDSDKPVSRQFEADYSHYYGWPNYWAGSGIWGIYPTVMSDPGPWVEPDPTLEEARDTHLRSTKEVSRYHLHATDGEIGHVDDFIVDDETWAIRYLVVSTHNWWPGKKVLVSPKWIERVSWEEAEVFVNLTREAIKAAPEYTEESFVERDYEVTLYGHYERNGYWLDEIETSEGSIPEKTN